MACKYFAILHFLNRHASLYAFVLDVWIISAARPHLSVVVQDFGFNIVPLFIHHIYFGMQLFAQSLCRKSDVLDVDFLYSWVIIPNLT